MCAGVGKEVCVSVAKGVCAVPSEVPYTMSFSTLSEASYTMSFAAPSEVSYTMSFAAPCNVMREYSGAVLYEGVYGLPCEGVCEVGKRDSTCLVGTTDLPSAKSGLTADAALVIEWVAWSVTVSVTAILFPRKP
jgi:hypothetical protein